MRSINITHDNTTTAGFSLIELSVVLVIIGLLVGGIMTGHNLVKASKFRSVVTQIDQYRAAIHTFHSKYSALPGDMGNAFYYWGSINHCANDDVNINASGCNGNSDGIINNTASVFRENTRLWQHLANGEMIEGRFTGTQNAGSPYLTLGVNTPATEINNVGISAGYNSSDAATGHNTGGTHWGYHADGNVLFIGALSNDLTKRAAFTARDLQGIDKKLDDGMPGSGWLLSEHTLTSCHTSSNADTATYNMSNDDVVCAIRALIK